MKITKHQDKDSLIKALPRKHTELGRLVKVEASPYMLVTLKDSVANNNVIEKAISKLIEGFTLVVAVENMTEEAAIALQEAKGILLTLRDCYWTDERHKYIQQFGGVKEKPHESDYLYKIRIT